MRTRSRWLIAGTTVGVLLVASTYVLYRHSQPPDARVLGVPIVVGNTVYLTDGSKVELSVDSDSSASQVTVVPSGVVFSTFHEHGFGDDSIWFRQRDGGMQLLGAAGNLPFTVARDGRTLIAVGLRQQDSTEQLDAPETEAELARVTAFDLATGTVLGTTQFADAKVVDADGEWAVLQRFDGTAKQPSELWNVKSGKITPFASVNGVHPLAVTATGAVLRRVDLPPSGKSTSDACYDLVVPSKTVPTSFTGFCGDKDVMSAALSPDGNHLLAETHDNIYILDVADLTHSKWTAAVLRPDDIGVTSETYWASNSSILTPYGKVFERCSILGACKTHHISGGGWAGFAFPAG